MIHEVVESFDFSNTSYYGDVIFKSSDRRYDGVFDAKKLVQRNIPHQAIFYSKRVFEKRGFNLKYPLLADYDLNIWLFSDVDYGFQYVSKVIALYNDVSGLSSTCVDHAFKNDFPNIVFKNYSLLNYLKYLYIKHVSYFVCILSLAFFIFLI